MNNDLRVILVSHSSLALNRLEDALDENVNVQATRILLNEEDYYPKVSDVLAADVMVVALSDSWERMLGVLAENNNAGNRPATVIVGPDDQPEIIKCALRAGAADYVGDVGEKGSLFTAIENSARAKHLAADSSSDLTLFVTPKGGSGSSTLVVNFAHILAQREGTNVLAMDLDIQYGNLPIFYNEKPSTRLANALINGEPIDSTILDACISNRGKNPNVLATYSDQVISPWDLGTQQVSDLFALLAEKYSHVLVDLPRSIDPLTFYALERAKKIVVTVQQTLSDMRTANQYIRLLLDQGIASDTICIIINRHEKRNTIRMQDFAAAFQGYEILMVPNDYKRVNYASDNTVALIDRWRSAQISKSLMEVSDQLWLTESVAKRSLFSIDRSAKKVA